MIMSLGSLIGAIVLMFLKLGTDKPANAQVTNATGMRT
jgi:hypothetical protein